MENELLRISNLFSKSLFKTIICDKIELVEAKYKDDLTWLLNWNYIDNVPKNLKYSVIFIDIDKFKYINDNFEICSGTVFKMTSDAVNWRINKPIYENLLKEHSNVILALEKETNDKTKLINQQDLLIQGLENKGFKTSKI